MNFIPACAHVCARTRERAHAQPNSAAFPRRLPNPSRYSTFRSLTGGVEGAPLSQKLSENANLVIFPGQTKAEAAQLRAALPRVNWHF